MPSSPSSSTHSSSSLSFHSTSSTCSTSSSSEPPTGRTPPCSSSGSDSDHDGLDRSGELSPSYWERWKRHTELMARFRRVMRPTVGPSAVVGVAVPPPPMRIAHVDPSVTAANEQEDVAARSSRSSSSSSSAVSPRESEVAQRVGETKRNIAADTATTSSSSTKDRSAHAAEEEVQQSSDSILCVDQPPPPRWTTSEPRGINLLPLDLWRYIAEYLPTHCVLTVAQRVCRRFRVAVSTPATAVSFWDERWRERYLSSTATSDGEEASSLRMVLTEAPIVAALQTFVPSSKPRPEIVKIPPLVEPKCLAKVLYFLEGGTATGKGGVPRAMIPPAKSSHVRVIDFEDEGRDCFSDLQSLALQFAETLEVAHLNGFVDMATERAETDVALRERISMGDTEPPRRGFGILFPLYSSVDRVEEEEEEGAATGGRLAKILSERGFASLPTVMSGDGGGAAASTPIVPLYHRQHLSWYWWMLRHAVMSDVRNFMWSEEKKFGVCTTLISPAGGFVELRSFASALQGVYPRFFVKVVFSESCKFPRETIAEDFIKSGIDLFCGGYGRVEVDIPPRIHADGFHALRSALHLPDTFPLLLLWNTVIAVTGSLPLLALHTPMFLLSYRTTLTDAAAVALATAV